MQDQLQSDYVCGRLPAIDILQIMKKLPGDLSDEPTTRLMYNLLRTIMTRKPRMISEVGWDTVTDTAALAAIASLHTIFADLPKE